jgi:hypothetical protein
MAGGTRRFRRVVFLVAAGLAALALPSVSSGAVESEVSDRAALCFGVHPNRWVQPGVWFYGTAGPDIVWGTPGDDVIWGKGGDDLICGRGGNDMLFGGFGRDRIQGGDGTDIIYGEEGRDTLLGGVGYNIINGGPSTDLCRSADAYVSCERPPVDALLATCPTAQEVAKVDAVVDMSFEYDPTGPAHVCLAGQGSADLTAMEKRAYNAVLIMDRIPFDAALPSAWTYQTLYDWFTDAVAGIRFRSGLAYSFCCDPAGVINLKADIGGLTTDLWRRYPFDVGIADVVILMAHEARHANGYPHYCTWVDGVGYTDDDDLGDPFGAWSVQYYLELWLADHTPLAFLRGPASYPAFYQDQHRIDTGMWANAFFKHCLP